MDKNGKRAGTGSGDPWTHRQAIQVVAIIPDDTDAALAVLDRARELLVCWDRLPARPTPILVKA